MTQNEYCRRLYDAAEAFYFAGILTSLPFDAAKEFGQRDLSSAASAMVSGGMRLNQLGAPPLVNFALSI